MSCGVALAASATDVTAFSPWRVSKKSAGRIGHRAWGCQCPRASKRRHGRIGRNRLNSAASSAHPGSSTEIAMTDRDHVHDDESRVSPPLTVSAAEEVVRDLEHAMELYRNWLMQFQAMLVCRTKPPRDMLWADAHHNDAFGRWYYGAAVDHVRRHPGFGEIGALHKAMLGKARPAGRGGRERPAHRAVGLLGVPPAPRPLPRGVDRDDRRRPPTAAPHRPDDRHREPLRHAAAGAEGTRPGGAHRAAELRVHVRHRPLQAGQRHLRPPGRGT